MPVDCPEGRLIRAVCLAVLAFLAASPAAAQVRDRIDRIDRIDRTSSIDRAARTAAAERAAQQAIERRRLQAQRLAPDAVQDPARANPLLADQRLFRARDGFAARRGEILALDLSVVARATALEAGMTILSETELGGGSRLARLGAPAPLDPGAALDLLRNADPRGVFDFNHAFAASAPEQLQVQPQRTPAAPVISGSNSAYLIGMIDGGVLATHGDLRAASIRQRAFPDGSDLAPTDHGTAVAGRLAETLAAPFSLLVADVLTGTGTAWTGADSLAEGLAWLGGEGAAVINISLAGPPNAVVESMVARSLADGARIVAAVGNGGPFSRLIYPAAYGGVIGVTAIDAAGRIYALASTGPHVDASALGVDIRIATLTGHVTASGTSYAAPVIAARLAAGSPGVALVGGRPD